MVSTKKKPKAAKSTVVVKQPNARPIPKTRARKLHPDIDAKYLAAITHPFSPHAVGARTPSINRRNTTASTLRFRGDLVTAANGSGTWIFNANPLLACFTDTNGSFTGDTTTYTPPDGVLATGIGCPISELRKLGTYRVVGAGVRIVSYLNDNNNGGRVSMGTFCTAGELPVKTYTVASGVGGAVGVATLSATDANWNFANDGRGAFFQLAADATTSIDYTELTDRTVALKSLEANPYILTMRPTLNDSCEWLQSEPRTADPKSNTCLGFNSVIIQVGQASASTPVLQYDVIIHIEQVDVPLKSNLGAATPASHLVSGRPNSLDHTNATAATQPHVFAEGELAGGAAVAGASMLGIGDTVATAASGFGGDLMGMVMGLLPEAEAALPYLMGALLPIGL